jgi:hypothetical protein
MDGWMELPIIVKETRPKDEKGYKLEVGPGTEIIILSFLLASSSSSVQIG